MITTITKMKCVLSLLVVSLLVLVDLCSAQEYGQQQQASPTDASTYPYHQESDSQIDQLQIGTDLMPATTRSKNRRKKLKQRRKNRFRNRVKNRYRYEETPEVSAVGDYDYEDSNQDRDDGYNAPKAPASTYNAPASDYKAPASSYQAPTSSYGAPSYNAPSYGGGGGKGDGFNDFLNALAAFLPIGLFLAAIPPNLITITTGKRKKRDESSSNEIESNFELDSEHPFLNRINDIGFEQLRSSQECQKRIFCEMSKFGANQPNANIIQKIFHYLSLVLPDTLPDYLDSSNYFAMVRTGNCDLFKCTNKSHI